MSGGSYDYAYAKITELADQIRIPKEGDEYYSGAPVEFRAAFRELLRRVSDAAHAIEWNDSGDGASDEADLILACLPAGLVPNLRAAAAAACAEEDRCRGAYAQAKERRAAADLALKESDDPLSGWEWAGTWRVEFPDSRDELSIGAPDMALAILGACKFRRKDRADVRGVSKLYRRIEPGDAK